MVFRACTDGTTNSSKVVIEGYQDIYNYMYLEVWGQPVPWLGQAGPMQVHGVHAFNTVGNSNDVQTSVFDVVNAFHADL